MTAGKHTLELRKNGGTGPLYFNAYLTNFTLEDLITRAGLEVKVEPQVLQAHPKADKTTEVAGGRGQASSKKVEKYDRTELANLADVEERRSGRGRTR